jgi:SOS-response transcriptional repressor LexA
VPNKAAAYILRVSGDSMIDAGIHPGDMVLVERTSQPRDGDIVIAEVDGEWTLKYFRQQGQRVWLESANAAYPPITPERELQVVAVVRAVVRKYASLNL